MSSCGNGTPSAAACPPTALKDAINIYEEFYTNMREKLSTRMEMQLFAQKPDIVVVRLDNVPILALEVKKPVAPPD
jgi:hypothetical protein